MMKSTQWMRVCAIAISSVATLSGCSSDPDPAPMNTAGTSTGGSAGVGGSSSGGATGTQIQSPLYHVKLSGADAAAGMPAPGAYNTVGCALCHGANAEGTSIGPEVRFTPKDYAAATVRMGRQTPAGTASAMVAFSATTLSDVDLEAINTWQNSFTKPTTGQGLYLAMCGNCHGPTTPTGGSAPVSIQGVSKAEVQMYVRNGGSGTDLTMRAKYMPKYDTTLLTDAELALIQTFLGSM